ncbi:MAG: CDP-diacylglycerol--serine O-phosphatidyltransferase [Campylobacterales bacterium]
MEAPRFKMAYLLPNLFTAGSIFLAILAIVASVNGDFERAFWLVVVSAVFDALDGRVARLTKTTSQFGKEFDSLADVIAFGVTPAFILYFAVGSQFGKFGILVTALFVIFGAVRLARFNIISASTEPNVFIGLPIPAAALFVVSSTMLFLAHPDKGVFAVLLLLLAAATSVLMVSNIRYPSFKQIDFRKNYFLKNLVTLIVLLSLFYLYPMLFLPAVAFLYVAAGPARALWAMSRKTKKVTE